MSPRAGLPKKYEILLAIRKSPLWRVFCMLSPSTRTVSMQVQMSA